MRVITGIFFVLLALSVSAQDHYHFRGGAAVPLGKYGAKKLPDGGYANIGYNFTFENKTFLNENFSVGFYISYVQNDLDTDKLTEDNFSDNPNILSASISSGPYKSLLVMLGPQYTIKLGYDAGLSLKGGLGAFGSFVGPLSLDAIVTDPQTGAASQFNERFALQGKLAFSFYLGADFHYFLSDSFGLTAYADYSVANPDFEVESESGLNAQLTQQIQFINIGAGIVIKR